MTDKEVMQMALTAFEVATTHFSKDRQEILAAQEALRAALAQPEREWQGLTDEEVDEAEKEFGVWRGRVAKQSFESGAWWANEKLLEKNT